MLFFFYEPARRLRCLYFCVFLGILCIRSGLGCTHVSLISRGGRVLTLGSVLKLFFIARSLSFVARSALVNDAAECSHPTTSRLVSAVLALGLFCI